MRATGLAAIFVLATSTISGHAQSLGIGRGQESPIEEMMRQPEIQKKAEAEKEYQKALQSIKPTGPAKNDPWADVRPDPKAGNK
jgi:hypothetical protein